MRTLVTIVTLFLAVSMLVAAGGCEGPISASEIDQMCQKRLALEGQRPGDAEARMAKCKQDAEAERVVKRIYECRIKAADLDTFWNRCR